jgi:hypothetical protein
MEEVMTESQQSDDTSAQATPPTPPDKEPAPDTGWVKFDNIRKRHADPEDLEYR